MASGSTMSLPYASDTDYTSYVVGFTAFCVVMVSLATIARCLLRYSSKTGFGVDDWLAIMGYFCVMANLAADFVAANNHGVSLVPPTPEEAVNVNNAMMIVNYSYSMVLVCGKTSLLFLYRRIFGMRELWFRIGWWATFVLVCPVLFTVCAVFASLMAATGSANPTSPLTMGGVIGVSFYCAITNVFILLLPVGMVRKLQIDKTRRAGLIFIFSLGSMGGIVAFVRAIRTLQLIREHWDPRYAFFQQLMLLNAETVTLITCASLPLMRPLLTKVSDFAIGSLQILSNRTSSLLASAQKTTPSAAESNAAKEDEVELKQGAIHCQKEFVMDEYFEACESTTPSEAARCDDRV